MGIKFLLAGDLDRARSYGVYTYSSEERALSAASHTRAGRAVSWRGRWVVCCAADAERLLRAMGAQ